MFDPLREFVLTHLSGRYSFHDLHHVGLVGIESISIPEQKHPGSKKSCSLISVDERMIPNDAAAVRRREFKERWIREGVSVLRSTERTFESSLAP